MRNTLKFWTGCNKIHEACNCQNMRFVKIFPRDWSAKQVASSNIFKSSYFTLQISHFPPCKGWAWLNTPQAHSPSGNFPPLCSVGQWGESKQAWPAWCHAKRSRSHSSVQTDTHTDSLPEVLLFFNLLLWTQNLLLGKNPNSNHTPRSQSLFCTKSHTKLHSFC